MRASDGTGQRGHTVPCHVWVNVTGNPVHRCPGVLIDWRRGDGGRWEALVAWVEGGGNIRARAHVEWLPQQHVTPVEP